MTKPIVGDIYWARTKSDIDHPHVVISFEGKYVVVCQITSNQNKRNFPGNIEFDEFGLFPNILIYFL